MKAEIICVGTEILLGDILNTNATFISKGLADLGIDIYYQSVVGDNNDRLGSVFTLAYSRSDIVIITGGLGPTKDDLTKEVVIKKLELGMSLHLPWFREIQNKFKERKIKMPKNNIKQALIPRGGRILPNDNGTACGIYILKDNKHIFLLPGPPRELKPMFSQVEKLLEPLSDFKLKSKVIKTYGVGESKVVELLDDLISNQSDPTIAPLAKKDGVHLRLTTKDNLSELNHISNVVMSRIGEFVWGFDDEELNEQIIANMLKKNLTISIVESCTGGLIASSLTDVPGSSKVIIEGQVLYSGKAKLRFLNISEKLVRGGIDYKLTESLALQSLQTNNCSLSLAITGALGPSAPLGVDVGEVYISLAYSDKICTKKFNFSGSRENIKERCVFTALHLIRQTLGEI